MGIMKKICVFLATIMVIFSIGTSIEPMQKVNAFSESELNYSDFNWYYSTKAGTSLYYYVSLDYETANELDVTGWKAALCPEDNKTLAGAVATVDISNTDKYVSTEYNYACMNLTIILANDIPEGSYKKVIFDAEGNIKNEDSSTSTFVNQYLTSFECDLINNDGYAYAYVYADNVPLSAETYPTFYAADKTTPVTSFNDYATEINRNGDKVHVYRLNILNPAEFTLDDEGLAYLYYKVNGGIGTTRTDANGFSWTYAFDLNNVLKRYQAEGYLTDVTATTPFDTTDSIMTANGTLNGQPVDVSVTSIQSSDVPEVQSAINNVVDLVNRIANDAENVAAVLKQYAPSLNISKPLAGGTLELTVPSGTDISSGIQITFADSNIATNVKKGDTIVVLHIKQDGTIEYIPATAGDGNITATFTSLSPIAWFKVETANVATSTTTSSDTTKVSPKTGENFWDFLFH